MLLLLLSLAGCNPSAKDTGDSPVDTGTPPVDTEPQPVDADGDGYTVRDGDCDDARADAHPLADELCNGLDENCNIRVDEGFADGDHDGLADCMDSETCDGVDNNGDGAVDEGFEDIDGNGIANCVDAERCDGVDNNGDGQVDEGLDGDGDGYLSCAGDCDDTSALFHPGATEVTDSNDNDCDGRIDENLWTEGALIAVELLVNPQAVSDQDGEWLEVYNASSVPLFLNGLEIRTSTRTAVVHGAAGIRLRPGEMMVLGDTFQGPLNGEVPVDVVVSGLDFANDGGSLEVWMDTLRVDATSWPGGSSLSGASYALDSWFYSSAGNDDPSAWCASTVGWAEGSDFGSPGQINALCGSFDHDSDGQSGDAGDCDDADPLAYLGGPEVWYDGRDGDCDGHSDYDQDGDGYSSADWGGDDCDDLDGRINPGAAEVCDVAQVDEDCDGYSNSDDSSVVDPPIWYPDLDGDAHGDETGGVASCDPIRDYLSVGDDCDDADAQVNPDAAEVCGNGLDDDCDGSSNGCGSGGTTTADDALYTLAGASSGDKAGSAAVGVGDLNGDGYEDLGIGAQEGAGSSGIAYVVYGPITGSLMLDLADVALKGSSSGDLAGERVVGGGDVTGDGVDDLWVAAPSADASTYDQGQVYLLSGATLVSTKLGKADAKISGEAAGDLAGSGLAAAGDVNEDGYADVLIGAPLGSGGGRGNPGAAYLVYGNPASKVDLGSADGTFTGSQADDYAGIAVDADADADGDGIGDFLVGASNADDAAKDAGTAYVVTGTTTGSFSLDNASARLFGELADDNAGTAVAWVGDTNGDGYEDLAVGATQNPSGGNGAAYLVLGPFSGDKSLADADGILRGETAYDQVGYSLDGADIDGNGASDVLVGAPTVDSDFRDAGVAFLFYGGWSGTIVQSEVDDRFVGDSVNMQFGVSVATGFDVGQDGFPDLLFGAWNAAPDGVTSGGAAYLYSGGAGY